MSSTPQRGRRRAEPASRRRPSVLRTSAFATATKCVAAASLVGVLVAAGSVASHSSSDDAAASSIGSLASTVDQGAPAISAPTDAAISFSGITVSSKPSPTSGPTAAAVKAEAEAVKPVAKETPAPPARAGAVDDPAAARAFASSQLASFGWGADQMSCLSQLWQRESEWLTSAENASSGAFGIAQSLPANKMDSAGSDWATNYETQIRWGMGYIQGRYGSPCGAWGHSESVGWY